MGEVAMFVGGPYGDFQLELEKLDDVRIFVIWEDEVARFVERILVFTLPFTPPKGRVYTYREHQSLLLTASPAETIARFGDQMLAVTPERMTADVRPAICE